MEELLQKLLALLLSLFLVFTQGSCGQGPSAGEPASPSAPASSSSPASPTTPTSPSTPASPATPGAPAAQSASIGDLYPQLADVLANPSAALAVGTSVTYMYLGYASETVPVQDAAVAEEVLDALAAVRVGGSAQDRWEDYGDAIIVRLADGTSVQVNFEGRAIVCDPNDFNAAYYVSGADRLWQLMDSVRVR